MLPDGDANFDEVAVRVAIQEKLVANEMTVVEFLSEVDKYLSSMAEQDEFFEKECEELSKQGQITDEQRKQLDQFRVLRTQAKGQMEAIRRAACSLLGQL